MVLLALAYSDVFWVFTYVHSRYALCLLLLILFVDALDTKTRDISSVSSVNSLQSQYCKALHFLCIGEGGATNIRFAPVVPWAKASPAYS
jgi:hypothetical protein